MHSAGDKTRLCTSAHKQAQSRSTHTHYVTIHVVIHACMHAYNQTRRTAVLHHKRQLLLLLLPFPNCSNSGGKGVPLPHPQVGHRQEVILPGGDGGQKRPLAARPRQEAVAFGGGGGEGDGDFGGEGGGERGEAGGAGATGPMCV